MAESTSFVNTFDTLGRLRSLLEGKYGVKDAEVDAMLNELQEHQDYTDSKIETLEEMNQENNERVIDVRAQVKASERKVQRLQMDLSKQENVIKDLENTIAQKDEIIKAYENGKRIVVESGATYTENHDSNVFLEKVEDSDIKAGTAATSS